MTRLALAKTFVTGTVTLQGVSYSFTASGSGTATADRVPEAKKLAVAASNTAAVAAARTSIDKILLDNSAVLTDLEITSLISNNLSTTVVVYKPIAISSVATSPDGVNYTLKPNTTIGSNQWLTVPNGISLKTGKYPFTNNGYFQVGEPASFVSTALKDNPPAASVEYSTDASNNGVCEVYPDCTSTVDSGVTFENYDGGYLSNYGTLTNNGTITNSQSTISGIYTTIQNFGTFNNSTGATINNGPSSYIENVFSSNYTNLFNNYGTITNSSWFSTDGTFNNYTGATITNNGYESYVNNVGTFTNDGAITNSGSVSLLQNHEGGIMYNNSGGAITNSGPDSFVTNYYDSSTFNNDGTITNSGDTSFLLNDSGAAFTNNGTITNSGDSSSTTNEGTWTGDGTCGPTDTCTGT